MEGTEAGGLGFIQKHRKTLTNDTTLIANGVLELKPDTSFWITVANFKSVPVRIQRNTVVGIMLPSSRVIFLGSRILEGNRDNEESTEKKRDGEEWQEKLRIWRHYEAMRREIIELLKEFTAMWSGQLWTIVTTKHGIELTKGAKPVYQPPYRAGYRTRNFKKTEIGRMLQEKVIEPSHAAWSSSIVIVPKKFEKLRFCVDYQKINAATQRNSHTIPRTE